MMSMTANASTVCEKDRYFLQSSSL